MHISNSAPSAADHTEHSPKQSSFHTKKLLHLLSGTSFSFVIHFMALVVMAFLVIPSPVVTDHFAWVVRTEEPVEFVEEFSEEQPQTLQIETLTTATESNTWATSAESLNSLPDSLDVPAMENPMLETPIDLEEIGPSVSTAPRMTKSVGSTSSTSKSPWSSRTTGVAIGIGGTSGGPTHASEKAVAEALKWIVSHQRPDGSWNFNHQSVDCERRCSEPGSLEDCTTGATGLALLPLLGAGQTHRTGRYKQEVERGLYYLVNRMKVVNQTGNLAEGGGNLYAHGIAAIVLTEAYGMSQDKSLRAPAQLSLNYIMYAQDPLGGGWRYQAKQAGDTSVMGWQLMALKSGHLAYLQIDPQAIRGASRFLDSVQSESGAQYGYTSSGSGAATSAIGLLSRMYLGWQQDHTSLQRGVEQLAKKGPSKHEMYYNYYATQVMRQMDGKPWEKWNEMMRDSLVESQEKQTHARGSWFMRGDHGAERGGRLYCTSLATMILEVYYRHLPIYSSKASSEEFPL
jgi:Squalene-hopene cyclase C-terminal domain